MAKVLTDDRHYAAIAQAIRDIGAGQTPMKPEQMAEVLRSGVYIGSFTGDGTGSVSLPISFDPDLLTVFCNAPHAYSNAQRVTMTCFMDLAAFGMVGGHVDYSHSGGISTGNYTTVSVQTRYARSGDTVTLSNLWTNVLFGKDMVYTVVAVKYAADDKTRITDYILSLPETGSTTLNRAKIDAAFTPEEWAALTAQKPGWTFSYL